MESGTNPVEAADAGSVSLLELGVYILNPDTPFDLINPEFLRVNDVVESSWGLRQPVLLRNSSSTVNYRNGVRVLGYPGYIAVIHRRRIRRTEIGRTRLELKDVLSPQIARRLLDAMPLSNQYESVTIDPIGYIGGAFAPKLSGAPSTGSTRHAAASGGVVPKVEFAATYDFGDRSVAVTFGDTAEDKADGLETYYIAGEIQRQVTDGTRREQKEFIHNIVSNWEQDMREFSELALQLHAIHTSKGS